MSEWIKIESEKDLPKERCRAFAFDKATQSVMVGEFICDEENKTYWLENASHYMIFELPESPKQ